MRLSGGLRGGWKTTPPNTHSRIPLLPPKTGYGEMDPGRYGEGLDQVKTRFKPIEPTAANQHGNSIRLYQGKTLDKMGGGR